MSRREYRVFVNNLTYETTWQDLKDHMRRAGDVSFVEIMEDSDGRSKGWGLAAYSNFADAKRAIRELHDTVIRGRKIQVREDREDGNSNGARGGWGSGGGRGGGRSNGGYRNDSPRDGGYGRGRSPARGGRRNVRRSSPDREVHVGRRVYIGNVPFEFPLEELHDFLSTAGKVLDVKPGRGWAVVEYANTRDASNAIKKLTDQSLGGRPVFVREDREDPDEPKKLYTSRVYVGNLPYNIPIEEVREHLEAMGEVIRIDMSRGWALAEFDTVDSARKAIKELTDTECGGRLIYIREDREAAKSKGYVPQQAPHVEKTNRIYVGNLPFELPSSKLRSKVESFGRVTNLDLAKGWAVVEYETVDEAALAIKEMNGSEIDGRILNVREDREERTNKKTPANLGVAGRRVYVGNLTWHTSWQTLKDHFKDIGNVVFADVLKDNNQRSKGCGIVEFETPELALEAINKLNDTELDGRKIFVREDRIDSAHKSDE